ncbi:branched-chain amino acid ABC transporter permease (plasmid) [Azospirillum argentinense]|uniref:Branched-chain amino acid ABC transporter permease n=1 Tax=Azospirillum argentinense TaxID=2970906 RepID=A0A060DYG7_9PROT|nr:branched-chain amino acid ABC transporter permease [Azospirillum argentinense]AIB16103.1 branched-chain amino acid ABC transporter permease [Azospirillum argentinense]EZQ02737.1 branched-chain amino acid ABC transporter permease [Azospirillum argentinense]
MVFDVFFLQQVINGLSIGCVYALMAIGFTLIFGVLNVVNFAHGEVYTIGAFVGLMVITALAPPLLAVVPLVLAVGAVSGVGLERIAFRPFRRFTDEASQKSRAMREATLLSSLAVSIVTREIMMHIFGGDMQGIPSGYLLQQPVAIGPVMVASGSLVIFATSAVMLGALQFLLYRTQTGLGIRAVSNNQLGARYVGINTDRTIVTTFAVGSMLGATAGILVGLYDGAISPHMGFAPGVKAFVAMVMGGLSSIPGAVACALLLGVSESIATEFLSSGWKDLITYSLLVITLVFFPQGLFGHGRERA